jgi:hypothetical protein
MVEDNLSPIFGKLESEINKHNIYKRFYNLIFLFNKFL